MYGGDVDPVVLASLLLYLVNTGLGLGHLAGSAHLDVPAAHQDTVHLLQGKLGCLGLLELHEGEPLAPPGGGEARDGDVDHLPELGEQLGSRVRWGGEEQGEV